ncbi:hypothetical protein SAMN04489867_2004 [Pedococcus dokdonensis]|uniref:Uncharacterized protein n=1 Tax=Pedococcus dokdonensis TaxID=443156 RepID=A0A1H0RLF3_9MICO|nr:hypothetical protein [Pedococcus dokdonensis]SDP30119.1 hypothetical protein SAMN04489867_2004 [Pedococcus dokdonensis]
MDRTEFKLLREGLTTNLPPASGALVDGAAARLRRRLESSVMFAQVELEVTEDPERLLIALVRYRPGTRERQVASFLEALWITELRLSGLDAFNFVIEPGYVELEAVTGDHDAGYFVSLQLVALEGDADLFARADAQPPTPPPAPDESGRRKPFWKKS